MSEKPTILIADDEPGVVAALAREARRAGLSYITDTTSQQVLELAVRHQPAVIILDLKQHVDGRDLLAALKRDPRTRNIKVLVWTVDNPGRLRRFVYDKRVWMVTSNHPARALLPA